MGDNIMIEGDNWLNELSSKLGKNFGRYKKGEISFEECDRLDEEIIKMSNDESYKELINIINDENTPEDVKIKFEEWKKKKAEEQEKGLWA
jgi:hypothetical protein